MLRDYLKLSPISEEVQLNANVILHRAKLSTDELGDIRRKGEIFLENNKSEDYELEVNGLTIAYGRIVKKKGEYYFKISEMNKGEGS